MSNGEFGPDKNINDLLPSMPPPPSVKESVNLDDDGLDMGEVEEPRIMPTPDEIFAEPPQSKGKKKLLDDVKLPQRGERGKDKAPRKKPEMTEARREHLKKARERSVQVRKERREAKAKALAEREEALKHQEGQSTAKSQPIEIEIKEKKLPDKREPTVAELKKLDKPPPKLMEKPSEYKNTRNSEGKYTMDEFFTFAEKYEEHKRKINKPKPSHSADHPPLEPPALRRQKATIKPPPPQQPRKPLPRQYQKVKYVNKRHGLDEPTAKKLYDDNFLPSF
jgi:hypothetical protein